MRGEARATSLLAAVVVIWALLSFLIVGWPGSSGLAASSAYEYQYPVVVSGGGTISGLSGNVVFNVFAQLTDGAVMGTCSVSEPRTKTKIKCLGVTSITLGGAFGFTLADLAGAATINDAATTYEIDVRIRCSDGSGVFGITTATGYHRLGPLTGGKLSIKGFSAC